MKLLPFSNSRVFIQTRSKPSTYLDETTPRVFHVPLWQALLDFLHCPEAKALFKDKGLILTPQVERKGLVVQKAIP